MNDLKIWLENLLQGLSILKRPAAALKPAPVGAPASRETLQILIQARAALGVDDSQARPAMSAGLALSSAVCSMKEHLEEVASNAAAGIDASITRILPALDSQTMTASGIIKTADFGDGMIEFDLALMGGHGTIFAGRSDRLPLDHPLHRLEPACGWFKLGMSPSLLLGPPAARLGGRPSPRPFYSLSSALALTARLRKVQADHEREVAERNRIEDERLARELQMRTPEARIAELERKLQEVGHARA